MLRIIVFLAFCLGVIVTDGCRTGRILLAPENEQIHTLEGYASLRITHTQGSDSSRFSFLFRLPDFGRMEVADILGRTLYQIRIRKDEAFMVIPSRRVYWREEESEILSKLLGFRVSLEEVTIILSGQGHKNLKEWVLLTDEKGRVFKGKRGSLGFEVVEFIERSTIARLLSFQNNDISGRLKVLSLGVNKPVNKKLLEMDFIKTYEQKSWQEIREIIGRAD